MRDHDELAVLKERVPLTELIDLPLRLGKALCPFHNENTPSFPRLRRRLSLFRGRGAHGDHFDWLTFAEGLTLPQAHRAYARARGGAAPASCCR